MSSRVLSGMVLLLLLTSLLPPFATTDERVGGRETVFTVVEEWSSGELEWTPSLVLNDTNCDGKDEMILWGGLPDGGSRLEVYDLPGYQRVWECNYTGWISLQLADLGGNGSVQLLIHESSENGENVTIISGADYSTVWKGPTLKDSILYEFLEDIDSDGELEFVWINTTYSVEWRETTISTAVYVYGALSHNKEWESLLLEGTVSWAEVESVDEDPALELLIITSAGERQNASSVSFLVYDGATHNLQWAVRGEPELTGLEYLHGGDVDGDGRKEVVLMVREGSWDETGSAGFRVLQGSDGALEWNRTVGPSCYADVIDIENDKVPELIATGYSSSFVSMESNYTHYIFSLKDRNLKWSAGPWAMGMFNMSLLTARELTGDSVMELVIMNVSFDFSNFVFTTSFLILDGKNYTQKWSSPAFQNWGGELNALQLDSDSPWELVLPESWSTGEGADYGVVHVYSTDTFKEEWKSEVYEGSVSATAMQIVNESRTELVIHTWSYDTVNGSSIAQLFVLDTDSHSVLWESPRGASVDIVPADLYGSSRNEIVAAVSRGDYPEVKGFFYAYNDTTLLETWSSGELQGSPAILCAGDIDGDGRGELAGSTTRDDPTGRRSKTVLTVWEFYEGPSLLPDLAILPKDIYLSDPNPVEGFPLNISAVATNIGNKASGAFCATFLVDGIQQAQTTLELPGGCSTTAVFTWAPQAGNHTLEVRLDPRNLVRELNENNNNASIRVSVRERPRPIAVITSPREGEEYVEGQNITFDGRSSLAPQGCEFVWSSDLSGPIGTGPLLNASLPMGDHTISLELLDPATGLSSSARVNIIVLPPPPPSGEARAVISSPREGARFTAGDPILFDGSRSQASERGLKLEFLWVSNISGELARIPKFTRALPPGDHMITLKVEDEHNRTQSASVNISVRPVDGVVAIIDSPLDGQVFEANQEIRFSASSSSGPPGCYLSYLWSSSISGPLSTEREFSRRLPFGNHTISLRVTDDKERSATAYVNITVKRLIDYPPVVAFVHPSEGAIVQGVVIINGTAWDDTEVVGVYVRIDNQPWDIASGTTSWSYRWDTTRVENGTHRISLRASDGLQSSLEVAINVTVANPPPPPRPPKPPIEGGGISPLVWATVAIVIAGAIAVAAYRMRRGRGKN